MVTFDENGEPQEVQHIITHSDVPARVNVSAEKNSRGFNYSATVTNAATVAEALTLLDEALAGLQARFGES